MTRRDFWILALILILGAVVTTSQRVRRGELPVKIDLDGLEVLKGPSHSFSETREADLAPGGRLEIRSEGGGVEVQTWDSPRVRVEVRKTVHAASEPEARTLADGVPLELAPAPEGLVARITPLSGPRKPGEVATDFTVLVPRNTRLDVTTRNGPITVRGVQGDAVLRNAHGSVLAEDLGGSCEVTAEHSEVIATSVAGDLRITTSNGDVEVRESGGPVSITTGNADVTVERARQSVEVHDRSGEVRIEDAAGNLRIDAPRCSVTVERVGGSVEVSSSADPVRITEVSGGVGVQTEASSVEVTEVRGRVRVTATHTDVQIVRPRGDVEVRTSHQPIILVPASGAGFRLDATSDSGEVSSEIPELPVPAERPSRFAGSVGDRRSTYRLSTTHAPIEIRKAAPGDSGS